MHPLLQAYAGTFEITVKSHSRGQLLKLGVIKLSQAIVILIQSKCQD